MSTEIDEGTDKPLRVPLILSAMDKVRRDNLRAAVSNFGGGTRVSEASGGVIKPSLISQQISDNPYRRVSEKAARKYEIAMKLPHGHLDIDRGTAEASKPMACALATVDMAALIRTVGALLKAEGIAVIDPDKMADLIALAYEYVADHGGAVREDALRKIIRFLK